MREGDVILDNINYGQVKSSALPSGVKFVGEDYRLKTLMDLGVPLSHYKELDEYKFYPHLRIEFYKSGWSCPLTFWAVHQENVMEVAKGLSMYGEVRVTAYARILAFFENGGLTRRSYIDSFYEDVPHEMKRNCEF